MDKNAALVVVLIAITMSLGFTSFVFWSLASLEKHNHVQHTERVVKKENYWRRHVLVVE